MVENRTKNINVCFRPTEKQLIIQRATQKNQRVSDFVRGCVLSEVQGMRAKHEAYLQRRLDFDLI